MRGFISIVVLLKCIISHDVYSQGCCSGGGNNPLAGGAASGVMAKGQIEVALSNQYGNSKNFFTGDSYSNPFFEKLESNYAFLRTDIGITDKVTLSTAAGYFSGRTIYEFRDTNDGQQKLISSKGFADLIILPRYQIFNVQKNGNTKELDFGLGMKYPLGSHNDSTFIGHAYFLNMNNGSQPFIDSNEIWQTSPPLVQATTGSNDFIAYLFYMNSTKKSFSFYVNSLYILRGWNSLGIRFGDFASVGLFFGKTFFKNRLSILGQIRGEWVGEIRTHDKIDYLAEYNIETASTGSKSVFFSPQVGYTLGDLRLFALVDIPAYQYLNGTQVALPRQITGGITYRFYPNPKSKVCQVPSLCKEPDCLLVDTSFRVLGNCNMCKEKIEKTARKLKGVFSADWDLNTFTLHVVFDAKNTSSETIKEKLAAVGYDSETHKANQDAYNRLHSCCRYPRDSRE